MVELEYPCPSVYFKTSEHIAATPRFEHVVDGQVRSLCMSICLAFLDLENAGRGAFASRRSIGQKMSVPVSAANQGLGLGIAGIWSLA
jgi:hypothetical protein